jgi:hypothetical protein
MNRKIATPLTYLGELLANSIRHGGELIVAVGCVIASVLATLGMRSWLHLPQLGGPLQMILVLLPPIGAVLLLETGVAAWRLHRRQGVALATRQTLLDLNAGERAELEYRLVARYRRRERRIGERNEARVERLTNEIAALSAR